MLSIIEQCTPTTHTPIMHPSLMPATSHFDTGASLQILILRLIYCPFNFFTMTCMKAKANMGSYYHLLIISITCIIKSFTSTICFKNIFIEPFQHISRRVIPSYKIRESSISTLTSSYSNFSSISPNDLSEVTSIITKTW